MEETNKPEQGPLISKGKYELSLSEFPVTLLSRSEKNLEFIEYKDKINGKGGVEVERTWRVYPDAKWGFGNLSTLSTLYELFQIWKDQEFKNKTITFGSIYSLAKRKGIIPTNTSYATLKKDLRCLTGIVVEAKNAFWDNEKQAYVDAYFHLFERVRFYKESQYGQATLPFSYIEASDELYGSIVTNSLLITDFDSRFFHSLKPVEQRLALYLSKMLRNQNVHKRDLMKLAEQLPLTTTLRKKAKQQVKKACEGLIEREFKLLKGFDFEKSSNGSGENVIFYRNGRVIPRKPAEGKKEAGDKMKNKPSYPTVNPDYVQVCLLEDIMEICGDRKSENFYKKVVRIIPKETIYQVISEVREVKNLGTIKKSEGALFTKLIKAKAKQLQIEL